MWFSRRVAVLLSPAILAEGPGGQTLPFLAGACLWQWWCRRCRLGVSRLFLWHVVCVLCVCWCVVLWAVVPPIPLALVCVCVCSVSLCIGVGAVWGLCVLGLRHVCVCVCGVWVQVCGFSGMSYLFWFLLSADMVTIKGRKQSPVNV